MNWEELGKRLSTELEVEFGQFEALSVTGGDINRAWCLQDDSRRFFVKTNRAELLPMFEAERVGLDTIRMTGTIRIPQVYATGIEGGLAWIVMEYIDLSGSVDAEKLAMALAKMHASTQTRFGFHIDNSIGKTPQVNTPCGDWIEFWRRHRLGFQLQMAERQNFDIGLLDAGHRLNEQLGAFFATYQPQASLLHGDLWSGNWAADLDNNPVIYDPACYYGDHEADLAMMELFGHPGERFFSVYRDRFPIDAGYGQRRALYNLYHIFNHAFLFGGNYKLETRRIIERLLAEI